jgi:hypothetical protein
VTPIGASIIPPRHSRKGACEKIEARQNCPLVMAVLDTAIQEKPKHFNPGLDGRVKPGHDNRARFRFFHILEGGDPVIGV